tara:strand:- start:177 stop:353 length:177 start_codon:yes stop_codon:yes gene_type:complete
MANWHGGKGSRRRPEDTDKIKNNWDKIFKKKPQISGLAERLLERSLQRKADKLFKKDQ